MGDSIETSPDSAALSGDSGNAVGTTTRNRWGVAADCLRVHRGIGVSLLRNARGTRHGTRRCGRGLGD